MKKVYNFYADGVSFGQEYMTLEEAQAYAKEYMLTFEEADDERAISQHEANREVIE